MLRVFLIATILTFLVVFSISFFWLLNSFTKNLGDYDDEI